MAHALVSVILEQLALAKQEVGVKEEVQRLTDKRNTIHAVLEDVERRQFKDPTAKRRFNKLKDVFYDLEKRLDEWNTADLKMKIEGEEIAPKLKRKVCYFIPSSCFCYRQVDLRRDIAIVIKKLNKTLDVISVENDSYKSNLARSNEELERRRIARVIDVSIVHGRDQDKNIIVNMLSSESSQGPTLRIISIVGMGGVGKTTLAQLVYNDDTVKAHFQKRIWVCVSDPFDELRIALAIFRALRDEDPNSNELEFLWQQIHHSIEGKRFLLVLDDVWTEDYRRLDQLKDSLTFGSPGSRILVTTHKEIVAKNIGKINIFQLGQLSNEECWSLFSQVAFFERSREECKNLEDIGRRIAEKCEGLPLAAKVLGSLLRFKITKEEWQSVLDSEFWKLEEASLFPPLVLSYFDMSPTLRQCFSYCAIFPKGYEIEKDRLIKLWMAQGYLRATDSTDLEMVGEECFEKLAMHSFFQEFKKDSFGTIITCTMHNMVYDFAQFLTDKEYFVMDVELRLNSRQVKARHSMFRIEGGGSIFAPIKYVKNLRSLMVEYKSLPGTGAIAFAALDEFTCLRTLDFSGCKNYECSLKKLPNGIGKLIHLRYLNLAYNDALEELSETVCDLCNLQSLNVSHCRSLKNLPRGLGRLINLRHLEISSTGVSFMPRGVERLTSLRTLDTFYVSSGGNVNEAATLEELKNLNYLRRNLLIRGLGKVRDVNEVNKAQLQNKEHLIGLILDFDMEEEAEEGKMINDEQVIEAIQPPPNLEELKILCYRGRSMCPYWMTSFTHLKKVLIWYCSNCEVLPPLGKLSSLESLTVQLMHGVKRVGNELLGIESEVNKNEGPSNASSSLIASFPKLKELIF